MHILSQPCSFKLDRAKICDDQPTLLQHNEHEQEEIHQHVRGGGAQTRHQPAQGNNYRARTLKLWPAIKEC
jgi:hypothetical protein